MRPLLLMLVVFAATPAAAAAEDNLLSLEQLLQSYGASAGEQPPADVAVDAWIEQGSGGGRELVIVLQPEGETRLNADPGITVTPDDGAAVAWQVMLPHRHIDPAIDYFEPRATVRMPFEGGDEEPIRVLVEFAYCVVDYQCFLGEEQLTVTQLVD